LNSTKLTYGCVPTMINYDINLKIANISVKHDPPVKYLGLIFDTHLSWKMHVHEICKKISRGIGILSKLRHYVNPDILIQLYYSLIYPFLTYCLIVWGNTYPSTIKPITILQNKSITHNVFLQVWPHSSPLFHQFQIVKFPDLIYLLNAIFMYQFKHHLLPAAFAW
jgi:hypothetical protein